MTILATAGRGRTSPQLINSPVKASAEATYTFAELFRVASDRWPKGYIYIKNSLKRYAANAAKQSSAQGVMKP